jgi:purine-cytosine permease-like protein
MWRRLLFIVLLFVLAAVLWWVFQSTRLPPGLESKGPENWMPWLSLAGSIVSLLTGVVTLGLKLTETRRAKPRRKRA